MVNCFCMLFLLLLSFLPAFADWSSCTTDPSLVCQENRRDQVFTSDQLIHWHVGNLDSAIQRAKETKKPVFSVFYMPWCGPSQYLINVTFKVKNIADFINENSIPILLNGEEVPQEFSKYSISGFPSVLQIRSNGEEADRVIGGVPPEEGLKEFSALLQEKTPTELLEEIKNDPPNAGLKAKILKKYANRIDLENMLKFKSEIENAHPVYFLENRVSIYKTIYRAFFEGKKYTDAINTIEELLNFEETPLEIKINAFLFLSYSHDYLKNYEHAFLSLERGIKVAPQEWVFHVNYLNLSAGIKQNFSRAIELGKEALLLVSASEEKAYVFYCLAKVYKASGNIGEAKNTIDEAIKLDPDEEYKKFKNSLEQSSVK